MKNKITVKKFSQRWLQLYTFAINVRNALVSTIFRKTMKLSSKTRTEHTTGEITNYISVDSQRFLDTIPYMFILWATPYQIVLAFVFLYIELGVAALAGLVSRLSLFDIIVLQNLFHSISQKQIISQRFPWHESCPWRSIE